jgi:hypothetical protein
MRNDRHHHGHGRVQDVLPLRDIDRDVVWLRGGGCRAVVAAGSVNFALLAEAEQEALLAGYRAFLNSLRFPLQVLVRIQPTDVERYLDGLRVRAGAGPALARLALDHEAFVRRLTRERTLLERQFFVIVPAGDDALPAAPPLPSPRTVRRRGAATAPQQAALAVRELAGRCDQVAQGLAGLGLGARRLSGEELATLWYAMLAPDRARRQPLPVTASPVAIAARPHAEEASHVR